MSHPAEHLAPGDGRSLTLQEFADAAGVGEGDVQELKDYQLLPDRLDMAWAMALREAQHLRADFDLDLFATGLLAGYIRRVHALQAQLCEQQAQARSRNTALYTEVRFTAVRG